jgi:hypothetical protein
MEYTSIFHRFKGLESPVWERLQWNPSHYPFKYSTVYRLVYFNTPRFEML